ncbi:MAG: carbamoyl-phosphate synthase L chain ATP-binding protein, partial [Acidimicrobiia bacterium]|nr:carbamoyl-phosphate synthase L chain ATP-binding protein [Acidimicrobiia bacterium]
MAATTTPTITKLLVANRGEIARRVFRTASEAGIRTVAVYADGDARAPFVADADEAVALGGTTSAETYLEAAKILDAARRTGADAIHPGYGFLSENAGFAAAVADAGLIWVGPTPEAMGSLGDKLAAKAVAAEAGVPMLASVDDPARAAEVGFPLLVKAAAGGGGRGMRVVERAEDLAEAVATARREAGSAFGDDRVFLERYLADPRHVEIQVLGDHHGAVVHLGERDCSIQRRHQKIVEESPSPAVDAELRAAMGAAAVTLARAVGYRSAGTVEFLVDGGEFYFLEMNTRLQVEHPVTEEVARVGGRRLDLVREQLRIAQGEPLGYDQDDVSLDGHAVEVRLYAEDPANDFLPTIGVLEAWAPPASPELRWDSGVAEASVVGVEFDPMLAKVIAWAPSRREAALKLALGLERLALAGVVTNRDFLVEVLRHDAFLGGDATIAFIERHAPARRREPGRDQLTHGALVAALVAQAEARAAARVLGGARSGFRNSAMPSQRRTYAAVAGDGEIAVEYRSGRDGRFAITIDGADGVAELVSWDGTR